MVIFIQIQVIILESINDFSIIKFAYIYIINVFQ